MKTFTDITNCPNCQSKIRNYRGDGILRRVCSNKCQGWKVIEEFDILNLIQGNFTPNKI